MSSLDDRIRTIAQDVFAGDSQGTLREEFEQFKNQVDETVGKIAQDVHEMGQLISEAKAQLGNG